MFQILKTLFSKKKELVDQSNDKYINLNITGPKDKTSNSYNVEGMPVINNIVNGDFKCDECASRIKCDVSHYKNGKGY